MLRKGVLGQAGQFCVFLFFILICTPAPTTCSDHFLCLCKRHYHLFTDLGNAEGSIPPSLCPEHHNWLSNCLQAQGSGVPQVLTITVLRLLVASLVLQASQKMVPPNCWTPHTSLPNVQPTCGFCLSKGLWASITSSSLPPSIT